MAAAKNRTVAIVRRVEHLNKARSMIDNSTVHFVCMSMETFLTCRQEMLSVSTPSYYDRLKVNYTERGQKLASEWVTNVLAKPLGLSQDDKMLSVSSFMYFFSMALFALDLIKAVTEEHNPAKVYVWQDDERPIIGDWPFGYSEGAVFAQVCAGWLAEQGICAEFLDFSSKDSQINAPGVVSKRSLAARLRPYKPMIPPRFIALHRFLDNQRKKLPEVLPRFWMHTDILVTKWRRRYFRRPLIMFWGGGTDSVYQAELAEQWSKERGWYTLCFDTTNLLWLSNRNQTRNASVLQGHSASLARKLFGATKRNDREVDLEDLLSKTTAWLLAANPDAAFIGPKSILRYQYAAMIQGFAKAKANIQSLSQIIAALSPDCVVSHCDAEFSQAARLVNVPSVQVSHGGVVKAETIPMNGDVNVVCGNIQKEYYEEGRQSSGKLLPVGWPHIKIPQADPAAVSTFNRSGCNSMKPCVVFFAESVDLWYWNRVDFDAYAAACQKLKDLAHTDAFRLIVKLHPRYADIPLYNKVFSPDGDRVLVETTKSLNPILEQTDLAVLGGLSTALLEVAVCHIPTVVSFYHYKTNLLDNPYFRRLPAGFPCARNLNELEGLVVQLLSSSSHRKEVIGRQNEMLPELLNSYGETASRHVADICQQLLSRPQV